MRNLVLAASAAALAFATPAAAQDAAADAVAITDAIWPDGSIEMMMGQGMDEMMDHMVAGMLDMPVESVMQTAIDLAQTDEEAVKIQEQLSGMTFGELMRLIDPHFEERQDIMNSITMERLKPIMIAMEPDMKSKFARVMERLYSPEELAAARAFFDTDMGMKFGEKFMAVYMDPEYLAVMGDLMPKVVEVMPAVMEEAKSATAHLPDPKIGRIERLEAAFGLQQSKD